MSKLTAVQEILISDVLKNWFEARSEVIGEVMWGKESDDAEKNLRREIVQAARELGIKDIGKYIGEDWDHEKNHSRR